MEIADSSKGIVVTPPFKSGSKALKLLTEFIDDLKRVTDVAGAESSVNLEDVRREWLKKSTKGISDDYAAKLKVHVSVLCDLLLQGWSIQGNESEILMRRRDDGRLDADSRKRLVQRGLLVERSAEFRIPSVREFIRSMETRRLTSKGWFSVFDLMRDGELLAKELSVIAAISDGEKRLAALSKTFRPYLQFVDSDKVCDLTGLRLGDIWRYFRYTWSSVYKSTPGRTILILIRDAAVANHPVVGIAAISNAVVQQSERDDWIGWTPERYISRVAEKPSNNEAVWLLDSLDKFISDIYVEDFLEERVIAKKDLREPTAEALEKLLKISIVEKEQHFRFVNVSQQKAKLDKSDSIQWVDRARTHLFRSKRSSMLSTLLTARKKLQDVGFGKPTTSMLAKAIESTKGREAIATILRKAKANRVGIDMMAITVCGSIAPYNALLGGKLVSLMMTSPEVVLECRRRYEHYESIIASSMSGKAVIRKPNLVFLDTTSLYGVASSQYNRLRVDAQLLGGKAGHRIEFVQLKNRTLGYGSFHFSKETVNFLSQLTAQRSDGKKVNSIFGEGVSPRLRKIRDGLALAGLPAEELMLHGDTRIVYCVPLAENFREVLLEKTDKPRYFLPLSNPRKTSKAIADYWMKRWVSGRINRGETIEAIAENRLTYPMKHGARVLLPGTEEESQLDIFT